MSDHETTSEMQGRLRVRANEAMRRNGAMLYVQPTQVLILLDTIEDLRADLHEALLTTPHWG